MPPVEHTRPNPITRYRGRYGSGYVARIQFDGNSTIMRYGWPDSYAQPEGWLLRKYRTVGYRFMPLPEILDTIWRTGDAAWRVEIDRTGHFRFGGGYGLGLENYNPRWARFENLDHQTVRLRRGEDLLLVSKPAAAVGESELGYALFTEVGQHEDPPRHDHAQVDPEGRGIYLIDLPPDPQLIALESWTEGLARRTRFGTGELESLFDSLAISDLLLFEGIAPSQPTLDDVLDPMLATRDLRAESVGLFWEIYGLERGATADVRVRLERPAPSGIAAIFSWLPFVGRSAAPEVGWTFTAQPDGEGKQAFAIDLPVVDLDPGVYTLSVVCDCGRERSLESAQEIRVRGR
jgi:hypothetical protein